MIREPNCNYMNNAHIGFSSEIRENNTGINYYNYRYYAINMAFWLKRDPLYDSFVYGSEEMLNLYNFIKNNVINKIDYLGLSGDLLGITECNVQTGKVEITIKKEHTSESNCVYIHEKKHEENIKSCCAEIKHCEKFLAQIGQVNKCKIAYYNWLYHTRHWDECSALKVERRCLKDFLKRCKNEECKNCKIYKTEIEKIDYQFKTMNCKKLLSSEMEKCYVSKIIFNAINALQSF